MRLRRTSVKVVGFACFCKMLLHHYRLFCIAYIGAENGDIFRPGAVYLPPLAQHYQAAVLERGDPLAG